MANTCDYRQDCETIATYIAIILLVTLLLPCGYLAIIMIIAIIAMTTIIANIAISWQGKELASEYKARD